MDNQQPSINNRLFYLRPQKGNGFIYKYTSPSGKSYIGQTVNSLKDRAKNLLTGSGYSKCTVFWKAIEKYGWQNFNTEILEEVPISKLNEKEQQYIYQFNSLVPNGYNICNGGEGGKTKDIFVYSAQNGDFIEHYSSLTEASIMTLVPISTISTIINNKRKMAHNLVFLNNYIEHYDVSNLLRSSSKTVYVYDSQGQFLSEYNQIILAAKSLNITEGSIRKCLNGYLTHVGPYQFKQEKYDKIDPIPKNSKTPISVQQIDLKTGEVLNTYPSLSAAAKAVGLTNSGGIKKVIERGKGTSGGYFWKIDEGSTTKYE